MVLTFGNERLMTNGTSGDIEAGFDVRDKFQKLYNAIMNTSNELPIIENGFMKITMPDGTVYARPLIDTGSKFSLFGDSKSDVLFGGSGDDLLQGRSGDDLLLGGNGYDTYFVGGSDTIIDDDGKGRVFLSGSNKQLTGGTQIEQGSKIYKGKDGTTYELKDNGDLLINNSITIEKFTNEKLEIYLSEFDEILVTISDSQAVEKAEKMEFTISLSKEPELGQFVIVKVNEKTYKFVNLNLLVA